MNKLFSISLYTFTHKKYINLIINSNLGWDKIEHNSNLTKKKCDFIASIPMKGTVNSLNASVAAALVIYEAVRNR